MAATMHFTETNGAAAGTETDIGAGTANNGNIRYQANDRYQADSAYPLVKNGSNVRSYKKSLRFKPHTGSTYTTLDTLRVYVSSPPANVSFYFNATPPGSYAQATAAATDLSGSWTLNPTSGAPITVTGTSSANSVTAFGNYIECYLQIADAISTGTTTATTFTFQWNEI